MLGRMAPSYRAYLGDMAILKGVMLGTVAGPAAGPGGRWNASATAVGPATAAPASL
jgi:hypothetical protein